MTRSVTVGVLSPPLILVPWEGGLHPLGSLLIWTEGITALPRLGSYREEWPSFSQQRQRPCVLEKESCPGKQKNSKTPAALQSRPAQSLPLLTPLPAATATAVSSSRPFVNPLTSSQALCSRLSAPQAPRTSLCSEPALSSPPRPQQQIVTALRVRHCARQCRRRRQAGPPRAEPL